MKTKRLLSLLLTLMMILTLLPKAACANTVIWTDSNVPNNISNGDTITFSGSPSGVLTIDTDSISSLTLDGGDNPNDPAVINNGRIDVTGSNTLTLTLTLKNVTINADGGVAAIKNNSSFCELTLNIIGIVTLTVADSASTSKPDSALYSAGNLTINGNGTLNAAGGNNSNETGGNGIYTVNSSLTIGAGCTIVAKGGDGAGGGGVGIAVTGSADNSGNVTATGGNSTNVNSGGTGFYCNMNTITNRSGGSITAVGGNGGTNAPGGDGIHIGGSSADGIIINESGGTITGTGGTGGTGSTGGTGIYVFHGSITNSGSMTGRGGTGGASDSGTGGAGGNGIYTGNPGGSANESGITNESGGTITGVGGAGGASDSGTGGAGGMGVTASGDIINNGDAADFLATGGAGGISISGTSGAGGSSLNKPPATGSVNTQIVIQAPSSKTLEAGGDTDFNVSVVITSPVYQWQVNTGSGWSDVSNNGMYSGAATDTLSLTGVTYAMNGYQYRCKVSDSAGASSFSAFAVLTVQTVPTAPQNFTAVPGDTEVSLSWAAPADNGGAGITKYQYSVSTGADDWQDIPSSNASTTGYIVTGLTNNTSYTFKVRAVNSIGSGAESVAAATPAAVQMNTAAAPAANPAGGEYAGEQTVTLSSTTANAVIYYTLDGTTPTTSSAVYSGAITVQMGTTLKAYTAAFGYADSAVITEIYTQQSGTGKTGFLGIYETVKGSFSGSGYTQGSGQPLVYTINKDLKLFSGVEINGKAITRDTDYKAESGSTVITVFAECLNTLTIGKHTLTVSFTDGVLVTEEFEVLESPSAEREPWENPFADVFSGDWFYGDVEYVYTNGLMSGTGTEPMLFSPNMPLTRGMVVTILYNSENHPNVRGLDNPFSDVFANKWYCNAVKWAADNDIVTGYDGRFNPEDNITRQDLAVILWRFARYTGRDVSVGENTNILSYADAFDVAEYAIPAVQWCCGAGIVNGRPGGLLDPCGTASRAEAAAMLHRLFEV